MIYLKRTPHGHDEYFEEESKTTQITPQIKRILTSFRTGTGTWNVVRAEFHYNNKLSLKIDHGYSYFKSIHFCKDGLNYIISPGASYQEGIITCLDTLKSYKINHDGWCPVEFFLNPSQNILCISGCFWAAPYEYRFYDISNLENIHIIHSDDMEMDAENEQWKDDETFVYKFISFIGKDGKNSEETPWKSHEVEHKDNNFTIKDIENKTFDDQGNYTQEFIDNFQQEKVIKVKIC